MKRSEILANRKLVIEKLRTPGLKKARGHLANSSNARCCLGHMTHFLGIEGIKSDISDADSYSYKLISYDNEEYSMPQSAMILLGMHSSDGSVKWTNIDVFQNAMKKFFNPRNVDIENFYSLAEWNDQTNIRPHHIADYLESVIEGGDDTPWKALSEYPE